MTKIYSLLAFLCLCLSTSLAQKAPIEWGVVPKEDLKMTHYPLDSSAKAVVLANYGHMTFTYMAEDGEPRFELKIHKRIKILDRAAFDEGDIAISFFSEHKFEEIKGLKAQLFTPDGKIYEVGKEDVFEEKVRSDLSQKKFTFPHLVEGAVLEYQYTLYSRNLVTLEDWYFQEDIPVRWSELRMDIPGFYRYVFLNQGRAMDISEQDNYNASLTIPKYVTNTVGRVERKGVQITNAMLNTHRFVQKDVPALKEEAYITTMEDYVAKMRFQLNTTAFPNAPVRAFLSDWPAVAKRLMKEDFFGLQWREKGRHNRLWAAAESYIQDGETPLEKITLAYNFINSNIEWNRRYTYSCTEKHLDACFEKKKATSGEMNLMLLALLQEAGIEAQPVLVSTRNHGKVQTLYPILNQFNHTMVLVKVEEQDILLDAGNPFRPIGYPRVNALNYQAWVVDASQPQWITLTAPKAKEKILLNFALNKEGTLEGTVNIGNEGYDAVDGRNYYHEAKDGKHFQEAWTEQYPDIVIKEMEFENTATSDQAFKINMACSIPNQAQVMNDFIYFSPSLYNSFQENPFKLKERVYPVEMPYPFSEQLVLNLDLPEGYVVEELPEAAKVVLPNKGGSFLYMVKQSGQKIQVIRKITLNQLQFSPEEYSSIKTFFDLIIEKSEEQIVLKAQP